MKVKTNNETKSQMAYDSETKDKKAKRIKHQQES